MIDQVINYAKSISANDEILEWLKTSAKKSLAANRVDIYALEHVVDWLKSDAAPQRLRRLSVETAVQKSAEWTAKNKKRGAALVDKDTDIETFLEVGLGYKIVKLLTKNAFLREGTFMSHCLGGYNPSPDMSIFSLRDEKNNPHATFEVRLDQKEV